MPTQFTRAAVYTWRLSSSNQCVINYDAHVDARIHYFIVNSVSCIEKSNVFRSLETVLGNYRY